MYIPIIALVVLVWLFCRAEVLAARRGYAAGYAAAQDEHDLDADQDTDWTPWD